MSSIDVIVPCYRYGLFLKQCVESVLGQSHQDVHVLIIDDASPDNTPEVGLQLERDDSRVTFVRHRLNQGHISTYNEGIDWARSDYMLLLSADDYLLPGALSRAAAFLDDHPSVGFVFGNALELFDDGSTASCTPIAEVFNEGEQRVFTGTEFIDLSHNINIVPTPTAFVRTSLQKKVGGYRPQLPHSGDMENWWRLAAHSSVGLVGARQAVYRRHATNMSTTYYQQNRLPDLVQKKLAIDLFLEHSGPKLSDADRIRSRMLCSLGLEAVGCAGSAFNDQNVELSEQLASFAVETFPGVKMSWPWAKLSCKRLLGAKGWRLARSAAQPFWAHRSDRGRNSDRRE